MQRCLQLAILGAGNVAPNPLVGAVLVHDEKIIGEGYHKQYGYSHAEVNCINSVQDEQKHLIPESTLYVSLEPCVHYGKTPPCTDLIIEKKIQKVIIGCLDTYEKVSGKGFQKLKNSGVNVLKDVLKDECIELNKRFFTFHQKQRPYVILKWTQSADHKIGDISKRVFISNDFTNRLVHKWRSEEEGILAGTNTVLHDDPEFTTRFWTGKNSCRIVIDMDLKIPLSYKIFNNAAKTIIFNCIKEEVVGNLFFYKIPRKNNLLQIMKALHSMDVQSILVEGGAKLLQSFIEEGLWDEARVIENQNLILNDGVNAPCYKQFKLNEVFELASDKITYFKLG